jgi:predicted Abi (CAAX) family protease
MKILNRIGTAISTIPKVQTWLDSGKLLVLYGLISLPVGLSLGFLKLEMVQASSVTITKIITTCLVMPAMTEELCFRVLLLPHPAEKVTRIERWLWASK